MEISKAPVNELARACAHSTESAQWAEFMSQCAPIAGMVAIRIARIWRREPASSVVDDIVQEVFLKLCDQERRILREFRPQGENSFFALLRVVTASVANDYFRRQYSVKRGGKVITMVLDDEPATVVPVGGGRSGDMQRAVLFSELDRKLRAAPGSTAERDRTIFWFYYLQGLTAEEIAELPAVGLSPKGVESALRRVTVWLRKELEPQKMRNAEPAGETGSQC